MRVGGRLQGGRRAIPVPFVALDDVGQNQRLVGRFAACARFERAAVGAHLRVGDDKNLHIGIRADHGPDVAPVEHGAGRRACELALKADQHLAHGGDRRHHGSGFADPLRLQLGIAEFFGIERHRNGHRARLVGQFKTPIQQRLGDRAVNHAGVEMAIAVMTGEPLAERALAGSGGSVDGDDHENSAPSDRIIGMKSGKLVAMKAVSSTLTGLSAASPITSADIAMR